MKILFFIGSLRSGGKERRLIELLTWLKQQGKYELFVLLAYDKVDYPAFHELGIPYRAFFKKLDYRWPSIYWKLHRACKDFKPDIIHTWGSMRTFNLLPVALYRKTPIVNSQITDALPRNSRINLSSIISRINFRYSTVVTANSHAGLASFNLKAGGKYHVIYNGIRKERFEDLPQAETIRKQFGLQTKYAVVMVGSFTANKDYEKYLDLCKQIGKNRKDITFFAVGDGPDLVRMKQKAKNENIHNIVFTGRINNVEALVSVCDTGVLFSPHGEGVSNAIMEYMALGKPVIANDAGGTKEIVAHNQTGFLIKDESIEQITSLVLTIVDNKALGHAMGNNGKDRIIKVFSIQKMGIEFENAYQLVFGKVHNI